MKKGLRNSVLVVIITIIGLILLKKKGIMTKALSRGMKNNNPFNMDRTATKWLGETVGTDARFCSFLTLTAGLRAGLINLYNGYFSKGLTIMQIVHKYSPGKDISKGKVTIQSERNYVDFICKRTGLASFSVPEKSMWLKVAEAILYFENGMTVKSVSDLAEVAKDSGLVYYT